MTFKVERQYEKIPDHTRSHQPSPPPNLYAVESGVHSDSTACTVDLRRRSYSFVHTKILLVATATHLSRAAEYLPKISDYCPLQPRSISPRSSTPPLYLVQLPPSSTIPSEQRRVFALAPHSGSQVTCAQFWCTESVDRIFPFQVVATSLR